MKILNNKPYEKVLANYPWSLFASIRSVEKTAKKIKKKLKTILETNKKKSHLLFWATVWGELYEFAALFQAVFSFRTLTTEGRVGANLSILTHIIMTQKCMTRQKYPNSQSEHFKGSSRRIFRKLVTRQTNFLNSHQKYFQFFKTHFFATKFFKYWKILPV